MFRAAVDEVPEKVWLVADDATLTYAQALLRIERAAGALRSWGLGPGDRVLVTARNTASYLLAWLALMEVGATQVPLNPSSTAAELAGFVHQVDPRLIVTDPPLAPLVSSTLGESGSTAKVVDID